MKVNSIDHYFDDKMDKQDWIEFLIQQQYIVQLTSELYVEKEAFHEGISLLKRSTQETFEVKEAKETLGLSRKYVIPFLEKLDKSKYTIRLDQSVSGFKVRVPQLSWETLVLVYINCRFIFSVT